MIHLLAYFAAIDATTNFDVPLLNDDVFPKVNNHAQFFADLEIVGAYAGSLLLDRARVNSPTLRVITPQYIRPVNVAAIPPSFPQMTDWVDQPFALPQGEEVSIEATATGAGPSNFTALLWITDGIQTIPNDNVHVLRFTSTTAAVANVWTSVVLAFEQALPTGWYMLVGSQLISTNGIAHRWILPGQTMRPGAISSQSVGQQQNPFFQRRRLGVFGRFVNTVLPTLQVLANAADAAHTGYMELIKVA